MSRAGALALAAFVLTGAISAAPGTAAGAAAPGTSEPAAAAPVSQPIHFRGDDLVANRDAGQLVLLGNVVIEHGASTITADRVEINYAADGKTIDNMFASGNVRLTETGRKGRAERARYFPRDRRLVLEGKPVIWEGEDMLRGDRIELFKQPDRLRVHGAEAVIQPDRVRRSVGEAP